jgi:hypothetical protein
MNLFPNTNQYRIVEPERLMSSDPSLSGSTCSGKKSIVAVSGSEDAQEEIAALVANVLPQFRGG